VSLFCCYFDIWKTILGGGQQMVAAAVFLLSRPDEMVSWKTIIPPPKTISRSGRHSKSFHATAFF